MLLSFDGYDLCSRAYARIERPVGPKARLSTEQVAGRDGQVLVGVGREPLTIVAHLTLRRDSIGEWPQVRQEMAAALSRDRACVLTLPDEPDTYRMATASLAANVTEPLEPPVTFDVEFTCHDPVAYAAQTRSATVPSGGSVELSVCGTLPARLDVLATSALRDPSSLTWGIRLDGGDHMHVKLSSFSTRRVEIDGTARTAKVSGALDMITLDSAWLELAPGSHTLVMDEGTGSAVVTWRERWL